MTPSPPSGTQARPKFREQPIAALKHLAHEVVDPSERTVRHMMRTVVAPTDALEPSMRLLSNEDLAGTTARLRARLADGAPARSPHERAAHHNPLPSFTLRNQPHLFSRHHYIVLPGAALDSLLPEAFAAVREAARRTLGMRHYGVQLIGGAVLHQGSIAEMRTGEGKTLVATLAAFLNALPGKGTHVVTVNDYLAGRDAAWMGRVYRALGMTCGCVLSSSETAQRRAAYDADITYVTSQELGFDYLRDNMAQDAGELVMQRTFNFVIVDEVDSVLIDEGRNPLLISTSVEDNCGRYPVACEVAALLSDEVHYTLDRKNRSAMLTEAGMVAAEAALGVDDLWEGTDPWAKCARKLRVFLCVSHPAPLPFSILSCARALLDLVTTNPAPPFLSIPVLLRYVLNAVKAKELYLRDVHYIVRSGEIQIVDEFTGRAMPRRRWTDNIHQAVEAKEGLEVQGEQVTAATVTYQCFFQLYPKLAGMTGTARTEEEEFWRLYRMECVQVPTHAPSRRTDMSTVIYRSADIKWRAIADFVTDCHVRGSPVLVGTTSVEDSERLSTLLADVEWEDGSGRVRTGVPHNLLNARAQYAAAEARIIAQAGRPGTVTIATNMAGRGTDILLGGNPPGLARDLLERAVLGALSLEAADEEGRGTARQGAPVRLRPETEAALRAAAELGATYWKGQMARAGFV